MIDLSIKFVAVVGPTATGKTALALSLAEAFNGEVVCADSRTLYRGMDIGTAKPTSEERARVPHHLLDVINPGERLSAAAFKQSAEKHIADIAARGRLPLLVGGSGLYVDAVLFNYDFPPEADPQQRRRLDALTDEQLQKLLAAQDGAAYKTVDLANRRRVIRALETAGSTSGRRAEVVPQALVLGATSNKEIVQKRILQRVDKMLEQGFIDEVQTIGKQYGWDSPAFDVIGYRAFKPVVLGMKTVEEGRADFVRGDMALYKKQVTWFKRNPAIVWVDDVRVAAGLVREFLQSDAT